jgi:hypothetical protein
MHSETNGSRRHQHPSYLRTSSVQMGLEALEAELNLFRRVTLEIELNDGVSTCCFFKWTAAHGWPIGDMRHGLYLTTNGSKQKVQITDGSIITRVYIPTRGDQIKEQSCIPTKNFLPAKHENVPQLTNHVKTVPKPLIRANAQQRKKTYISRSSAHVCGRCFFCSPGVTR